MTSGVPSVHGFDPDETIVETYDDRAPRIEKVVNQVIRTRNRGNKRRGRTAEKKWTDLINEALDAAGLADWPRAEKRGILGGADVTWDGLTFPEPSLPNAGVLTQADYARTISASGMAEPSGVGRGHGMASPANETRGVAAQTIDGDRGRLQMVGPDASMVAAEMVKGEVRQGTVDQEPRNTVRQRGRVARRTDDAVASPIPSARPLPTAISLGNLRPEDVIALPNGGVDGGAPATAQSMDRALAEGDSSTLAPLDATHTSKEGRLSPSRVMSGAQPTSDSLLATNDARHGVIVPGYAFEVKQRQGDWPSNTTIKNALVQAKANAGNRTPVVIACKTTPNVRTEWRFYNEVGMYMDALDWLRERVEELKDEASLYLLAEPSLPLP